MQTQMLERFELHLMQTTHQSLEKNFVLHASRQMLYFLAQGQDQILST